MCICLGGVDRKLHSTAKFEAEPYAEPYTTPCAAPSTEPYAEPSAAPYTAPYAGPMPRPHLRRVSSVEQSSVVVVDQV